MKKLLLVAVLFPFMVHARADAPIGLTWGVPISDIVSKYKAKEIIEQNDLIIYELPNPPITLPNFTSYKLLAHKQLGLIKVVLSEEITRDPYGVEGKNAYFKYKEALTKKYGKAESLEEIGLKVYRESDEFYQCLGYQGCGVYFSNFKQSGISLLLEGNRHAEGKLKIIYESDLFFEYYGDEDQQNEIKIYEGL